MSWKREWVNEIAKGVIMLRNQEARNSIILIDIVWCLWGYEGMRKEKRDGESEREIQGKSCNRERFRET